MRGVSRRRVLTGLSALATATALGGVRAGDARGGVDGGGADSHVMGIRARLQPAPPLQLYVDPTEWADCNSPVLREGDRSLAFVSSFQPLGHGHRRVGGRSLRSLGPMEPVSIRDDPTPDRGKWIESVMRHADGRLYGWYHAETRLDGDPPLFLPAIGAMVSDDDGVSWRLIGEPLALSFPGSNTDFANGFVAGGTGDFCAVADSQREYVYLYASSYGPIEEGQGLIAARCPIDGLGDPHGALEIWLGEGGWGHADGRALPRPFLPPTRGWRYADPDAFWGPAIHYNRALDAYVMLLNRTAGGFRDWRQEGVYVSFCDRLDEPLGWTPPQRIVDGGLWYPQVVGAGAGDGDSRAGARARFFLSGFSAWQIAFTREDPSTPWPPAVAINRQAVAELTETEPRGGAGRAGDRRVGRRPRSAGMAPLPR